MIKVYSNCDEAELFVNGKSRGTKKRDSQDFPAAGLRWMVVLNEGKNEVSVVAKKGKAVVKDNILFEYQTEKWGVPAEMTLQKVAESNDTITVEVKVFDESGIQCLDADRFVRFSLVGDGELIKNQGTSTGSEKVQLYNGRAIIRAKTRGGINTISVQSDGLKTKLLEIAPSDTSSIK